MMAQISEGRRRSNSVYAGGVRNVIRRLFRGPREFLMVASCLSFAGCEKPPNLSTFAVTPVPQRISNLDWIELATDGL